MVDTVQLVVQMVAVVLTDPVTRGVAGSACDECVPSHPNLAPRVPTVYSWTAARLEAQACHLHCHSQSCVADEGLCPSRCQPKPTRHLRILACHHWRMPAFPRPPPTIEDSLRFEVVRSICREKRPRNDRIPRCSCEDHRPPSRHEQVSEPPQILLAGRAPIGTSRDVCRRRRDTSCVCARPNSPYGWMTGILELARWKDAGRCVGHSAPCLSRPKRIYQERPDDRLADKPETCCACKGRSAPSASCILLSTTVGPEELGNVSDMGLARKP